MARTVGSDATQTRERIVREAAKALRREGFAKTSVNDVMKAAGLTHGGFYAHFESREAMLVEALAYAANEALESLLGAAHAKAAAEQIPPLDALTASYLSDKHLKATESGCTIAALGSETRRQPAEVRQVATAHVKKLAAALARETPEPLAAISTLVGALVIARLVDDPALADDVRAAAKRTLKVKSKRA